MIGEITLSDLARIGAGREADVFELDAHRVLRLAFTAQQRDHVVREALVLRVARDEGAPVPTIHQTVTVDGRPGLILERLAGPDLLVVLDRQPWLIGSIGRTLGQVHARVHAVTAPSELPDLRDELRRQLHSPLVPDAIRTRALKTLDGLPDGDRLCHRDFHPGNVLRDGRRHVVIDWSQGSKGDAGADVARTCLLLAESALPEGASASMRVAARLARRRLASGYLRSYQRAAGVPVTAPARWAPVLAAARLAENVAAERPHMIALAGG